MPKSTDKMPWLKLWHEYLDKAKVQILPEALRARHINLLCVACKENACGRLPNLKLIAHMLHLSEEETVTTLHDLVEAGLVDRRSKDGVTSYQIHDWEDWQSHKSPAAVRQKRVRDKRNEERNALRNGCVTETVTNGVTESATRALAPPSGSGSGSGSQEGAQGKPPPEPGPEFTALGHLAIQLSSVLALGPWVDRMARLGYTAPMIRYALEEGSAASNFDQRWLQGILKRVVVEGLPEPKYATPLVNGHAPTKSEVEEQIAKAERQAREAGWKG
jgi:hypothetical protein